MANDQYTIPGTLGEQPLKEAMQIVDSVQHTPERIKGMFEYSTKAPEARIHSYRKTALDIEANRKRSILDILVGMGRKKMTLENLLESESYIGGEPFGPHDRFWLSHKGSSVIGSGNDIGDWYHVRAFYDSFGRQIGETAIHFETHPTHINKLYNGRPVPLSIAELETFVHAVELYEKNIRERLYPLDQEIHELMVEIDEENFAIPNTVEEMFGKEIVARVVANYKAQKGIPNVAIPDTVEEMFGAQAVRQITDDVRTTV